MLSFLVNTGFTLFLLIVTSIKADKSFIRMMSVRGNVGVKDTGHAENCGDPKYSMNFTWDPKDIDPTGQVLLALDMIAPASFDNGKYTADVYIPSIPDTPILSWTGVLTCKKMAAFSTKPLKCPIQQEQRLSGSDTISDLSVLSPGQYSVHLTLNNENGKQFLCAKLDVRVKETTNSNGLP
ncbi:hypothetical protein ACJMK2_010316 [Sinanodonta woodiana]|uniref:MD-2-related lipid-recognition domain-containing protein n=1 Tax=Sinanodonta woodiana TaxID=1069815 RepID=A0ABD3VG87_SINWO